MLVKGAPKRHFEDLLRSYLMLPFGCLHFLHRPLYPPQHDWVISITQTRVPRFREQCRSVYHQPHTRWKTNQSVCKFLILNVTGHLRFENWSLLLRCCPFCVIGRYRSPDPCYDRCRCRHVREAGRRYRRVAAPPPWQRTCPRITTDLSLVNTLQCLPSSL